MDTSSYNWGWTSAAAWNTLHQQLDREARYLYIDLEGSSYTIPGSLGSISSDTQLSVLKVGVNYKF